MQNSFVRPLLVAAATGLVWFLGGIRQPAVAESASVDRRHFDRHNLVIDLSMADPVANRDLVAQAESLAKEAIIQKFNQDRGFSNLQVVVVGDRFGEVIPILVVTVSRAQWQTNPQVNAWSKYYEAAYAILTRHGASQTVAMTPTGSTAAPLRNRTAQIDLAYDEGRLTGQAAQQYLSDLD